MSSHDINNQKRIHKPNTKLGVEEVSNNFLVTVYHNVKSLIYQAHSVVGKVITEHFSSQQLPIQLRLTPSSLTLNGMYASYPHCYLFN